MWHKLLLTLQRNPITEQTIRKCLKLVLIQKRQVVTMYQEYYKSHTGFSIPFIFFQIIDDVKQVISSYRIRKTSFLLRFVIYFNWEIVCLNAKFNCLKKAWRIYLNLISLFQVCVVNVNICPTCTRIFVVVQVGLWYWGGISLDNFLNKQNRLTKKSLRWPIDDLFLI